MIVSDHVIFFEKIDASFAHRIVTSQSISSCKGDHSVICKDRIATHQHTGKIYKKKKITMHTKISFIKTSLSNATNVVNLYQTTINSVGFIKHTQNMLYKEKIQVLIKNYE